MKFTAWGLVLVFAASGLGTCSCGLIFQGTTEQINVSSEPPGATVTLNSGETRVTPFTVTVPRTEDLHLHFSKPGYQSTDLDDNTHVEGGIMTADILPLLIPWSIDAASGAGYEHQQASVTGHLDPEAGASSEVPDKETVATPPASSASSTAVRRP